MKHDDDKQLTPAQARQKLNDGLADFLAGKSKGPVVFRLKRTKKVNETYPLKLTQQQRNSLVNFTRIPLKLKERLKEVGEGNQVFGVTRKELDQLNDEIGQASLYAPHADKQRLIAVHRKVAELFASDQAEIFNEEVPKTRKSAAKHDDLLYQFKITLLDIKPAIWRRIQVPDCTLVNLHEYIQAAFGWWNYHLHQFDIDGKRYSQPCPDDDDFGLDFIDDTDVMLSKLIPKSGRRSRWIYEYDFGDGWRHEVLFEGFPPAEPKATYPLCVEGERACPPEDCGGIWGYADYVAAMSNPEHERHQEMMDWRGPFDPEAFDGKKATKAMRKVK